MAIGKKMQMARQLVWTNGGIMTLIDVAAAVGPRGSLSCGYRTVGRAIEAGLVTRSEPMPGRKGASLILGPIFIMPEAV